MDKRAIGVFDSGLGGLTAVRRLHALMPQENIIYFGDTGRVPYGTRGRDIITPTLPVCVMVMARPRYHH